MMATAASFSSPRRNGNNRIIRTTNRMMLFFGVSIAMIATALFPHSVGNIIGGNVFLVSAFTTYTAATTVTNTKTTATTRRQQASTTTTTEKEKKCWTLDQLEDYASDETINVVVSFTTFGPIYRAVARAKHDESIVLGYVEGFLRPTQPKILHLDKMEIFQSVLEKVRKTHPNTLNFGGINIGLGLMMGYRCLLYASEPAQGSRTIAEFLAIDDEDFQHKRLVRYYRYAGFKIVKYVGEDARDIPDRMIWGGCGTLMKQDIPALMARWTDLFELMKARVEKEQDAKQQQQQQQLAEPTSSGERDEANE